MGGIDMPSYNFKRVVYWSDEKDWLSEGDGITPSHEEASGAQQHGFWLDLVVGSESVTLGDSSDLPRQTRNAGMEDSRNRY